MKFDNHIPIYIQIMDLIKKDIILGLRKPGEKLDSVREFSSQLKVNPNTVQKAYQEMENLGLAFSKRGIGTFIIGNENLIVKLKDEISNNLIEKFIRKMYEIGYSYEEILTKLNEFKEE